MKKFITLFAASAFASAALAVDPAPVYENSFEKAAVDKVPDDMLVLDGAFAVKEEGGNKFLELPGAPLETFGVLFGPTETNGLAVSGRVQGTGKGRRSPTFGLGLNGVGGYRLQIAPAKKIVELYRGDDMVTNAPFAWTSDSWTLIRLQSRPLKDGGFKIEGKAWKQGEAEPKDWLIVHADKSDTPAGRPSLWGNPYAGTPIRYDDLKVARATD